eukprot:193745_1
MMSNNSFAQFVRGIFLPEMAHEVIEQPVFLWSTRIIDIVCVLIITFVFIYHLWTLLTFHQNKCNISLINKWPIFLNIITMIYIFTQLIVVLLLTVIMWSAIPITFNCNIIVYILTTAYHLSTGLFFGILITRLQVAFALSALKYSSLTINLLYIFVIFYIILTCIGTHFIIYGAWETKPIDWCHVHIKETYESALGVFIWILFDFIMSIILMYLFIRPFRQLSKNLNLDGNNYKQHNKFKNIYLKHAILTWISIMLSFIALLLYLMKHLTILIEIIAPINCICIILMHVRYKAIFNYFCGCCLEKMKTQSQMDVVANDEKKKIR